MLTRAGNGTSDEKDLRSPWMIPQWLDLLAGWIWRLALVALAVWGFLQVFGVFRLVTVPIVFALIVTALFWPLRSRLTDWGVPDFLASWLIIIVALGSLGGIGWLAVVGVGEQLQDSEQWSETRDEVDDWLMDGPLGLSATEIDNYEQRIEDALTSGATSFGPSGARTVTEVLGSILLTGVLVFFFIKDGPKLWNFFVDRVRPARRESVAEAGRSAFTAITGYSRGVAITGVVDAVLIGAVLVVLGVPLAVPLALLTFFAAFIPIVGATVVGGLSVLVALVSLGIKEALIVGVATLAIQQIEGDIVLPLVMGVQVRLHPAVILIVLAAGAAIAGLIGALVSVPLAAMTLAAVRGLQKGLPQASGGATNDRSPPGDALDVSQ